MDVMTVFESFEDYWAPFQGDQGPAPTYVTSLSVQERIVLADRLRADLPTRSDGSIHLRPGLGGAGH